MPLDTKFNIQPYYNDHDPLKDYYRVLFKPGVSVQNREFHLIQEYAQQQIERVADNLFKRGTITEGCNFTFHNDYPYIKINDSTLDGLTAVPEDFVGFKAVNSNGLDAYIINSKEGFEATDPDLKTLYINYINSGFTANINSFSPGETLTIYDSNHGVYNIDIISGASGFSNTDTVIITPEILVSVTVGSIANGDIVLNPTSNARVEVIEADYNTYASANQVLLKIKPKNVDLANASVNAASWTINQLDNLTNAGNTLAAHVTTIFGSGLEAGIITNGVGKVDDIIVTNTGQDYNFVPHVSLRSIGNLTGLNALNFSARNYYAKIKIASVSNAVGSGYAFSVSDGYTYQQGHMLRVNSQTIIVEKYNQLPDDVVVGFKTRETIVTANEDETLFDNCFEGGNEEAEGADRLKLVPELTVLSSSAAKGNTEFNVLVEWSEGQPFRQNKSTQYSRLGDEMAQRTFDESGNYVVDTFQTATTYTANAQLDAKYYSVVVDPGQAYIGGYKVQTLRNYYIDVDKGLDTKTTRNNISLNYGNYIRINQVGGIFQFSTGDTIDLYTLAKNFLSVTSYVVSGDTTPTGTKIGTARIRSMILENGIPGDPAAVYRLFLFDVKMGSGKNFADVRSVYYNGTLNKGIADIVITTTAAGANVAQVHATDKERLLFQAGVESLKNSANTTYIYRTIDQSLAFGNNGIISKSIASNPSEFYTATGSLSDAQLKELYVVPVGNNLTQYANLTGTVSVNTTSALVVGTGTSFFSDFMPGDYIKIGANAGSTTIKKVVNIINTTALTVDSNSSFVNTSCYFKRIFPKNVPIPFGSRTGLYGNIDANGNILTLGLAHANGLALTIEGTSTVNTAVAVNIKRTAVSSSAKTANRKQFVKIYCGNNAGNTTGPWAIGVSDVFRMRDVYLGNSSVNTSSTSIGRNFYIDHNQTLNDLDISWLYKKPRSGLTLANTDYLLVEFDYYTRAAEGYFDTVSYLGTSNSEQIAILDSTPYSNLTTTSPSYEVPEVYSAKGEYYDLLNSIDFRPAVQAVVTPTTNAATAPLNPGFTKSYGNTSDPANDKKFPLPDATMETNITQYLGRIDSVFISGEKGDIYVLKGIPDPDPRRRFPANHPKESLKLQTINVPAYPAIPDNVNGNVSGLITTGIANERYSGIRWTGRRIAPILSSYEFQLSQPMVYTMEDIANLERRIKDLEYYVSLSILETSITNKIIPSSIDKSLNRFKFGFFADDFSTDQYSDTRNPQYAASYEIEGDSPWGITKSPLETEQNWANADKFTADNKLLTPNKLIQKSTNRITPPKLIWSRSHIIQNLPYIDEVIIDQSYATEDSVTVPEECIPVVNTVITAASNGYYATSSANFRGSQWPLPSMSFTFEASTKPGQATIYFNNYAVNTKYNVIKGNTVIASTNASAALVTNLSTNDKAYLQSKGNETGFALPTTITNFVRLGDSVSQIGKFSFTHDPSTGKEYTIVAEGQPNHHVWDLLIEYPLTSGTQVSTIVDPCTITNVITQIKAAPVIVPYVGTMYLNNHFTGWACSKAFAINGTRLSEISFYCTGLKPLTEHKFYLDGQDLSAWCNLLPADQFAATETNTQVNSGLVYAYITYGQFAATLGQPLITDASGKIRVMFNLPMYDKTTGSGEGFANWVSEAFTSATQGKTFGSSGYSTIMIAAKNSIATKLVAQRLPTAKIPSTPAGNP